MLKLIDFIKAQKRINNLIYHTPLERSSYLSNEEQNIFFKLENQQKTKSFKIRGALNKISQLTSEEKERGILAVSSGNHGIAVSYAAKLINIPNCVVFVPENTPDSKIDQIKANESKVIIAGKNYDEMQALGMKYLEKHRMTFIDPYNKDYDIYAGAGTISLEIIFDNPEIDTIILPLSGGGLATGVGLAAKLINPDIKVIGVQTASCPAFVKSFQENKRYAEFPTRPSVCEALMGGVGEIPFKHAYESMDEVIQVSEDTIKKATAAVVKYEKILIETSSAIGVAALMEKTSSFTGKNIAIVISSGNLNTNYFSFNFGG